MQDPFTRLPEPPRTLDEAQAVISSLWTEVQRLRLEQRYVPALPGTGTGAAMEFLERDVRLSESLLWRLQEDFFLHKGVDAWEQVPYYITNNTFIAETYAELIIAFLRDYGPYLIPDQPLYIVEMASGIACFSYYLVKALAARQQYYHQLRDLRICYVVTDFVESNVEWARRNEAFAPYIASGQVDFAIFRPENESRLYLRCAGRDLDAGATRNPVIAIGNYFFDSIRQDLFRTDDGRLQEGRLSFYRAGDPSRPLTLDQLEYAVDYRDVEGGGYADQAANQVLQQYAGIEDSHILFPVGPLNCIRNLLELSNRNLVLLSSDKGFSRRAYMEEQLCHAYQVHGSISYMVNYDAIRRYFEQLGGSALCTSDRGLSLVTLMGCLLAHRDAPLEGTNHYFQERLERANPINYLYYSQYLAYPDGRDRAFLLRALMALLRVCNADPGLFSNCAERLHGLVDGADAGVKRDLLELLEQLRTNAYPHAGHYNATFWLGRLFHALGELERARECYHRCIALQPDSANAHFNLGTILQAMERHAAAAEALARYLELLPGADDADEIRRHVAQLRELAAVTADQL